MRVLHLATTYPLHAADSNATFVASIAEGLVARGHECDVVLPWHPELDLERAGPRLIPFRYSPVRSWHPWGYAQALTADRSLRPDAYLAAPLAAWSAYQAMRRLLRQRRYDVVHAHWYLPNGAIAAAAIGAEPLVISCHGSGVFLAEKHGWARRLGARGGHRASAITACSGDLARRVDALAAGPPAERIPYGVDTGRFRPLKPVERALTRDRLAARHGLRSDSIWVFAIGRLVFKKGFDVLVDAVAGATAAGADIELLLAGSGPLAGPLRARAMAAGIADRVHLLGALPNPEVPGYYAAADAVSVPSVRGVGGNVDGLPNTLLEALASGAAVVASAVAGIPDVVRDGDNGVLVPEGDAAALAAALSELARHPDRVRTLGAQARTDAVNNLDWTQTLARFEAVYEAVRTRR